MHADETERSLRDRVRRQMLDLMRHMDYGYSTKLLSETQLAAKFEVSRTTIRTVLAELETEGKVIRRHGSGTYVNPLALTVETTLHPRVNMYDLICQNGYTPVIKMLDVRERPANELGAKLNLFEFDRITEVASCFYGNDSDTPLMYCLDYVDAHRFSGMDWMEHENFAGSIYDYIRHAVGVNIVWDIINVRGAHSEQLPALKEFFRVPDGEIKPLVKLEITNFDNLNQPSLLGNIYIDSDLIRLNIVRDLTKM
ncbi:MAG: GntR family transcriptional regulator [Clostridia bacterium]|nr:GntR family transcriptional regulator [Clostridia bacterium]